MPGMLSTQQHTSLHHLSPHTLTAKSKEGDAPAPSQDAGEAEEEDGSGSAKRQRTTQRTPSEAQKPAVAAGQGPAASGIMQSMAEVRCCVFVLCVFVCVMGVRGTEIYSFCGCCVYASAFLDGRCSLVLPPFICLLKQPTH